MTWTEVLWTVIYAILILLAGNFIAGWLASVVGMALGRTKLDPIVQRLISSLVRPIVLAVAVFTALGVLGIPITTFAAIAGAVTLAVGMSMQGSLSNVASGAILLSLRPFDADDTITAGGHTGKVVTLKLFCTVLATPDGNTVTLPNDVVWKGPIITYTSTPEARIDLRWAFDPDTDMVKVEKLLLKALAADERTLAEPAPAVIFDEATDLGPTLIARAWAVNADKFALASDLRRKILIDLKKGGVRVATRTR